MSASRRSSSVGRFACRRRLRLLLLRLASFRLGRRRRSSFVPRSDVLGPTAVVRADRSVLERERAVGDRVQQGTVVGDEQDRARERVERGLERLAALQVEVVRRLVEQEQVRARGDDEGEREPPPLASRERGDGPLVHLPAREEEASEQVLRLRTLEPGLVLDAVASTVRRSSSSISCCEKYAASTPWPSFSFPAFGSRRPSKVSSSVVFPEPFGPTSATCSPRSSAKETSASSGLSPAASSTPSASITIRPLRFGFRKSKPRLLARPRQQVDLAAQLGALLLQAADLRQLGLRVLGVALLVAEPLDEALEPCDVDVDPLRLGRGGGQRARPSRGASRATGPRK